MPDRRKNLVYLTVGDFRRLLRGFEVRQNGAKAQLGQGASLADFKSVFDQVEKEFGERAAIRYDSFVCWSCRGRIASFTGKEGWITPASRYCAECAAGRKGLKADVSKKTE